jgi:peptidylprolyl isomerase
VKNFLSNTETDRLINMSTALIETNMGNIKIELFEKEMPVTAGNFRKLVEKKFYDGVIFHRVIPGFMIQGGDPTGTGMGGPGYSIRDEFAPGNSNRRETISMANAGPNTGGSQFFINVADNNFLDRKHPVFGKVVEGMDIVDRISNVPRNRNDKPLKDIVILHASIL